MDEATARAVLGNTIVKRSTANHQLASASGGPLILWSKDNTFQGKAVLQGGFTADQLEAVAWWMRNKAKSP